MIKMRLHNKPFKLIENGQKIIEIRLNDKKRQLLQVGDVIEFLNRKTYKKINVKVIDLLCYNTFDELFKNYDAHDFGCAHKNRSNLVFSRTPPYRCISSDTYWTAKQDNKYANGV